MSGQRESYNFALLGAPATGKSCLISCFTRGLFVEEHTPTIDDEYKKTITFGGEIDLTIADLGGLRADSQEQEWVQRVKWANGVLIVYDCTNRESFELLDDIKKKVDQIKDIQSADTYKFPMIIVGTKADLEDRRVVGGSELKKWADEHGVSYYTEVGLAKDVYGAKEVFVRLIGDIRAQEQAKKEAAQATPEPEKRKSVISPRGFLSPRKRGTTIVDADKSKVEASSQDAAAKESKVKEKEMKKEQKEKEKEMKKQLKEQKIKEKEEKERQKKEQKEKAKAEKLELKKEQQAKKAGSSQDQSAIPANNSDSQPSVAEKDSQSDENGIQSNESAPVVQVMISDDAGEQQPAEVVQPEQASEPMTPEQKREVMKERKKRRETLSALLSPRRFSTSGSSQSQIKEKEDHGSIINRARKGTVSGDIEVVNEGLVSPRGEGVNTLDKKRSRLSLRRLRRSEIFPKHDEEAPTPQVQFVRVTKPLDALAEYKISPVPADSPQLSADSDVAPVNLPYLAPHVSPTPESEPQVSPRVRGSTLRSPSKPLPSKPLPSAPSHQPIPSGAEPARTETTAAAEPAQPPAQFTAPPLPTFSSMPQIKVDIPTTQAPPSALDFPNLEDLPIFQDLFPPPTHLGPPPPPPTQSGV